MIGKLIGINCRYVPYIRTYIWHVYVAVYVYTYNLFYSLCMILCVVQYFAKATTSVRRSRIKCVELLVCECWDYFVKIKNVY